MALEHIKDKYIKEAVPQMMKKYGFKSPMAVPRVLKVIINTGFGRLVSDKTGDDLKKTEQGIVNDLMMICGQRPNFTRAKKSISGFKLRQGAVIGAAVTLRGKRMYDFMDRIINIVLPRSRDFQGINPESFDKRGNLSLGFKEQIVFPEILPEKARNVFGLQVIISINAKKKEQGIDLLKLMGFPIKQ